MSETLTERMERVSSDFFDIFGCTSCIEEYSESFSADLDNYTAIYDKISKALRSQRNITDSNTLNNVILNNRGKKSLEPLFRMKDKLDKSIAGFSDGTVNTQEYTTPESYRALIRTPENPEGIFIESYEEWINSIWQTLHKRYTLFPSPGEFVASIVRKLGHPAFENSSMRLRILKQMLLNIDINGTDLYDSKIAEYCSDDVNIVNKITEDIFKTKYLPDNTLSPASDIKVLAECYGNIVTLTDNDTESILALLNEPVRAEYKKNDNLLEYIAKKLADAENPDEIFDNRDIVKAHDTIKKIILDIKNDAQTSVSELKKSAGASLRIFRKKIDPYLAAKYLCKTISRFKKLDNRFQSDITVDKVNGITEKYPKMKERTRENGEVFDALKNEIKACEKYFDSLFKYIEKAEERKKIFTCANVAYHNRNGSWEEKAEETPRILKCCEYLADGGNADITNSALAKHALFLFAFAFDMKYYTNPDAPEYNPDRDMEKKLFFEFYSNSIMYFFRDKKSGNAVEPLGVGLNPKNFREAIYIRYINLTDMNIRDRYKAANDFFDKVKLYRQPAGTVSDIYTRVFRQRHIPAILKIKTDAELEDYLQTQYVIDYIGTNTNVYSVCEESHSTRRIFAELLKKIELNKERTESAPVDISELHYSFEKALSGVNTNPDQSISDFSEFVYTIGKLLDYDNISVAKNSNISRTGIFAVFFHYFYQSVKKDTHMSLKEVCDEFSLSINTYLEEAGLQPFSFRNLFDVIILLLEYMAVNSLINYMIDNALI